MKNGEREYNQNVGQSPPYTSRLGIGQGWTRTRVPTLTLGAMLSIWVFQTMSGLGSHFQTLLLAPSLSPLPLNTLIFGKEEGLA